MPQYSAVNINDDNSVRVASADCLRFSLQKLYIIADLLLTDFAKNSMPTCVAVWRIQLPFLIYSILHTPLDFPQGHITPVLLEPSYCS